MIGVDVLFLGAIAYVVLEHGCRARPASRQLHWFELLKSGELTVSHKAKGRGDVDRAGRTRRQRAHA